MADAQDALRCTLCTNTVDFRCKSCMIDLCSGCVGKHMKKDKKKKHNVQPIEDVIDEVLPPECPDHSDQICENYCLDCSEPLCSDCMLMHEDHKVEDINDVVDKIIDTIKEDTINREQVITAYDSIDKKTGSHIHELQGVGKSLKNEIHEIGEMLHKDVDSLVEEYQTGVDKITGKNVEILETYRKDVVNAKKKMTEKVQTNRGCLKSKAAIEILNFKVETTGLEIPPVLKLTPPSLVSFRRHRDQMKQIFGQLVDSVPHGESGESLVVQCAYDYDEKDEKFHNNLYFKEKDRILLHQSKYWNSEKRWLMAVHLQQGHIGYIPRDYVASEYFDDVPEFQEWWLHIGKQRGVDLLCVDGVADGTFMICDETAKGYTLLVRFGQSTLSECEYYDFEDVPNVKEYPITIYDKSVSIFDGQFFPNLSACMAFHIKYQGHLCCPLSKPYPHQSPTKKFSGHEIDKALIVSLRKMHRSANTVLDTYSGCTKTDENITAFILKKPKGIQWGLEANDFIDGAEILQSLSHRRILSILGVSTKSLPIVMIAESTQWNLKNCLITHRQDHWTLEKLIDFAAQIAEGMVYVGEKGFAHGDLRAENIMVKSDFTLKIAGFFYTRETRGSATKTDNRKVKVTMKWAAPEIPDLKELSVKTDVWAYGVLLHEIITFGADPYPNINGRDVMEKVQRGYRMKKPTNLPIECPEPYYEVMTKCWRKDPITRPTFEYLFQFFDDYFISSEEGYDEPEY